MGTQIERPTVSREIDKVVRRRHEKLVDRWIQRKTASRETDRKTVRRQHEKLVDRGMRWTVLDRRIDRKALWGGHRKIVHEARCEV